MDIIEGDVAFVLSSFLLEDVIKEFSLRWEMCFQINCVLNVHYEVRICFDTSVKRAHLTEVQGSIASIVDTLYIIRVK